MIAPLRHREQQLPAFEPSAGAPLRPAPAVRPAALVAPSPAAARKTEPSKPAALPAPSARGAAPAAAAPVRPMDILRHVETGDIEITVPAVPGSYGRGANAFKVRPQTLVTLRARVENGRLVPGKTRASFSPPLDNKLWVETEAFTLTRDGKIRARLRGWRDKDRTQALLGVDRIPLDLRALYELCKARGAKMAQSARAFTGDKSPLATEAFALKLRRVTLAPGALPLGDPQAAIVLGRGSRLDMHATARGVELRGTFSIARLALERGDVSLSGTKARGSGRIALTLDERSGGVLRSKVAFEALAFDLDRATLRDVQGARLRLGESKVRRGSVSFGTGEPTRVSLPELEVSVEEARLPAGDGSLAIVGARCRGGFRVGPDGVEADVAALALIARSEALALGPLSLGKTTVEIAGHGRLRYAAGDTQLSGALRLDGSVQDARFGAPGGPLYVDVARDSHATVSLSSLRLRRREGGDGSQVEFSGHGELDVELDEATLLAPDGTRLSLAAGSRAELNLEEITHDAVGTRISGRASLEGTIASQGKIGLGGKVKLDLGKLTLGTTGDLTLESLRAKARLRARRISGRIELHPRREAAKPSRAHAPQVAFEPASRMNVVAPSAAEIVSAVDAAHVRVNVPVPAGDYGTLSVSAFGKTASISPLSVAPGTVATVRAVIKGGVIQRGRASVVFEPPLDLPGFIGGRATMIDAHGHVILVLDHCPDIDLTERFGFSIPTDLDTLLERAMELAGDRSEGEWSLDTLAKHGITAELSGLTLSRATLGLGGDSFVTLGADNALWLRLDAERGRGRARFEGKVDVAGGTLHAGGATISGITGRARVRVSVVGDQAHVALKDVALSTEAASLAGKHGDFIGWKAARLTGDIVVAKDGIEADLKEVRATLGPSRISVSRDGARTPVDLHGGRYTGELRISRDSGGTRIRGQGRIEDLRASASGVSLGLEGLDAQVKRADLAVSGEVDLQSGSHLRLTGEIAVAATLAGGTIGESRGPFGAVLAPDAQVSMTFDELALGAAKAGTVVASGHGQVKVALKKGHLRLEDGLTLRLAAGTRGTLTLDEVEQRSGERAAALRGTLRLEVRTTARIAKAGLALAPNVHLEAVDGAHGRATLVIDDVELDPDGRYRLGGISLDLALEARRADLATAEAK